ncbi:MAG TPA: hypothetical protein VFA35_07865 [Burkholderiaceae bacterium]|nr:hypothetical protein [Burkholderiaceae bacterium]
MSVGAIDFLHRRRSPWLGWCLLAIGAAALSASLWLDQRWTAERAHREAVARTRDEAMQQARRAAMRPLPPTADQRRLQRIASQLRQPWLPVLRVIENITEAPVFLLALSIDPATGIVQLDGEAPNFDYAMAYAQLLDEEGLLGPAELRSHELVTEPGTGRATLRFTIVTRWSAR